MKMHHLHVYKREKMRWGFMMFFLHTLQWRHTSETCFIFGNHADPFTSNHSFWQNCGSVCLAPIFCPVGQSWRKAAESSSPLHQWWAFPPFEALHNFLHEQWWWWSQQCIKKKELPSINAPFSTICTLCHLWRRAIHFNPSKAPNGGALLSFSRRCAVP